MARNQNQAGKSEKENEKQGAENVGAKQEAKKAIYISRYRELRIVTKAAYSNQVDGRVVTYPGKFIQFHEGVFETENQEEIQLLEGHKNFGNIFIRVEAGTKEAKQIRDDKYKDLEQKNKELAAKLAAAEKENKKLKGGDGEGETEGEEKVEEDAPAY